jgi:PAS domain S-box-containing protein
MPPSNLYDTSLIDAWVIRALVASSTTLEALDLALGALRDALGARGVACFGVENGVVTCEVGELGPGAVAVGATVEHGPVVEVCRERRERFFAAMAGRPSQLIVPVLAQGEAVAAIALLDPEVEALGPTLDEQTIAGRKLAQFVTDARSERLRRAAEESLAEADLRHRLVSQAAADVLRTWDVALDRVEWSEGLQTVLGCASGSLSRLEDWLARIHPDDRTRVEQGFRRALEGSASVWSAEYRIEHGDGRYRTVFERARIGRDAAGRATVVGAATTDVTDRRRIEGRLVTADRLAAVGTLAAGVAHEINNPLSFVVANLAFVSEELAALGGDPAGLSDTQTEIVTSVQDALIEARDGLDRVRRIVSDLRTFARGDGGKRSGPVDVEVALEGAIRIVGGQLARVAQLVRRYERVPAVEADEARLEQIFLALLVNAMQAIEEGRPEENEVLVATRLDKHGRVVVEVADSGVGMSREVMARIFDPFFTTKPLGVGTGLGLSICHGLVRSIGGDIFVDSRLGFGSTFRISLPSASGAPAPTSVSRLSSSRPKIEGRVLIVDDEASVLAALHRALAARHEVVVLQSARSALELLASDASWDVILTDVSMPELSGLDLREAIAAKDAQLAERVVFMTGGAYEPSVRAALEALPNKQLDKPFDVGVLRALVQERVEARKS